jgi:RNA polymerase sigma factor (sigma-70 family)
MDRIVVRLSSDASWTLRDDIFQEVFAKAGRRFRGPGGIPHPVTVVLFALVISEVRTQTRRQVQARRRLAEEPDEEVTPASKPGPEQLYETHQEQAWKRQLVAEALGAMRPESAALIRRVDIEGLSNDELALELGCSANAVGHRLERARAQFSKIIHELRERNER